MATSDHDGPSAPRPTSRARRIGGAHPTARPAVHAAAEGAVGTAKDSHARVVPDEPAAATPAATPRWVPAVITVVGAAAAVVFLVLGLVAATGVWWGGSNGIRDERGAVLAAAKSCMATMNSYDYRTLVTAEKAGLACTTGRLTDEYRTAMEKVVKPQAAKIQFTQTAQVLNAGIESVSLDGSQWTILIFGQLTTTNSATASTGSPSAAPASPGASSSPGLGSRTPRLNLFSARAVMERAGGQWKIANYEYSPSS